MANIRQLSKSKYCKGIQCPKILWLDYYKPEEAEDVLDENVIANGNMVGELARDYFGDCALVNFSYDKNEMLAQTRNHISSGAENIAEAAFMFDELYCAVDILHKNGDGCRPYEQIPFQYSLHIEYKNGKLEHRAFLAKEGQDPRRELAESLFRDIPMDVCVTAYNMSFEKTVIRKLSEVFEDLAEHLIDIHDNIHDLMIPFQQQSYYSAAMQGSYSIKYVLPALYPEDAELDYHNLEGVHNGAEASATFADMPNHTEAEIAAMRENLLRYCELDTYAMVKVLQKLKEVCKM